MIEAAYVAWGVCGLACLPACRCVVSVETESAGRAIGISRVCPPHAATDGSISIAWGWAGLGKCIAVQWVRVVQGYSLPVTVAEPLPFLLFVASLCVLHSEARETFGPCAIQTYILRLRTEIRIEPKLY